MNRGMTAEILIDVGDEEIDREIETMELASASDVDLSIDDDIDESDWVYDMLRERRHNSVQELNFND